jgi:hypothetical protein
MAAMATGPTRPLNKLLQLQRVARVCPNAVHADEVTLCEYPHRKTIPKLFKNRLFSEHQNTSVRSRRFNQL